MSKQMLTEEEMLILYSEIESAARRASILIGKPLYLYSDIRGDTGFDSFIISPNPEKKGHIWR